MTVEADATEDLATRLRLRREREGLSRGTLGSLLQLDEDEIAGVESRRITDGPAAERVATWLDASRSSPQREQR